MRGDTESEALQSAAELGNGQREMVDRRIAACFDAASGEASGEASEAAEEEAAAAATDDASVHKQEGFDGDDASLASLAALEAAVWIALDALIRELAQVSSQGFRALVAPRLLLALLPPPPDVQGQGSGWPPGFALQRLADELRQMSDLAEMGYFAGRDVMGEVAEPFVTPDARYPPRRRAARLSFVIWAVIRDDEGLADEEAAVVAPELDGQTAQMQRALEASGTAERLAMAAEQMRALRVKLRDGDDEVMAARLLKRLRWH